MDIIPSIELDMAEYGGRSGDVVVMAPPSARAQIRLKNEAGRRMGMTAGRGVPDEKPIADAGDLEVLMILAYVKKAPFEPTLNAFFDYCDTLADGGNLLLKTMAETSAKLQDGSSSPSQA